MQQERWVQAREIFENLIDLPTESQEAFVASRCANDAELREVVGRLLVAHKDANRDNFLESPAWSYQPEEETEQVTGQRIGKYELIKRIQGGGMGIVYLAKRADGVFNQKVVIKAVRRDMEPREVKRFERERQILADLNHPNIAHLKDGGYLPDGRPYLVMEYIEGENIRETLARRQRLPMNEVVELVGQICDALSFAHNKKIIHRDIKPDNILLTRLGDKTVVKIVDFGIAVLMEPQEETGRNDTSGIIGTARYMSPEQAGGARRDELDARSDIYSLGLIVYEMLTGEPVFRGDNLVLLYKHLNEIPVSMRERNPNLKLPENVDKVVLKALEKNRDNRQQTAGEFAIQLKEAAKGVASIAAPVINVIPPDTYKTRPIEPKKRKKFRRRVLAVTVAVAMVLASLAVIALIRQREEKPQVASKQPTNGPAVSKPDVGSNSVLTANPESGTSSPKNPDAPNLLANLYGRGPHKAEVPASPNQIFHTGDGIRLSLTPSQNGFLCLLHKGSSGQWHIIYPSSEIDGGRNKVKTGREIKIPSKESGRWFDFDSKPGIETLYAILASKLDDDLMKTARAASRTGASTDLTNSLQKKLDAYIGSNSDPGVWRWQFEHVK